MSQPINLLWWYFIPSFKGINTETKSQVLKIYLYLLYVFESEI
jgi:hypothetical protein